MDLNTQDKTINFLKENTEDYYCNFVIGRDFFRYPKKTSTSIKNKTVKLEPLKTKTFW